MITSYKKFGVSASCDITPGLLDLFYIDPFFNPEMYREIPEVPEEDKKIAAQSAEAFTDPENFVLNYTIAMPVRNSTAKVAGTSGTKAAPRFAIDASIAESWAALMDSDSDEDESAPSSKVTAAVKGGGEGKSESYDMAGLPNMIPPPPGFNMPPPGFNMRIVDERAANLPGTKVIDGEADGNAEGEAAPLSTVLTPPAAPPAVYRKLVLLPRTLPIQPSNAPPA